jgi:hypothetical protein
MRQNTIATDFGNGIFLKTDISSIPLKWQGADELPIVQIEEIQHNLRDLETAFYLLQTESGIALAKGGKLSTTGHNLLGFIPTFKPERLGNDRFKQDHQTKFAYYAGAMANGIASVEMVIALGKQGYLACFGTGGLPLLPSIQAIRNRIQQEYGYEKPTRVGAAGGLGTPAAIAATFAMEADYVVLGSVNQACLESGTSHTVIELGSLLWNQSVLTVGGFYLNQAI